MLQFGEALGDGVVLVGDGGRVVDDVGCVFGGGGGGRGGGVSIVAIFFEGFVGTCLGGGRRTRHAGIEK